MTVPALPAPGAPCAAQDGGGRGDTEARAAPCPVTGSVKAMPPPPAKCLPGPCGSPGTTAGTGTGSACAVQRLLQYLITPPVKAAAPPEPILGLRTPPGVGSPSGVLSPPPGTIRGGTARPRPRPAAQPHTEPGCQSGLLGGHLPRKATCRAVRDGRSGTHGARLQDDGTNTAHATRSQRGVGSSPQPCPRPLPTGASPSLCVGWLGRRWGLHPLPCATSCAGGAAGGSQLGATGGSWGAQAAGGGGSQRAWGGVTP